MDKISLRKYNKIMIVILLVIIAVEILCLAYHNWDFLAWIFWIVLAFDIGVLARPYLIKEDDE